VHTLVTTSVVCACLPLFILLLLLLLLPPPVSYATGRQSYMQVRAYITRMPLCCCTWPKKMRADLQPAFTLRAFPLPFPPLPLPPRTTFTGDKSTGGAHLPLSSPVFSSVQRPEIRTRGCSNLLTRGELSSAGRRAGGGGGSLRVSRLGTHLASGVFPP